MKYNIPLMDVGYPINLSYGSGTGMDDEASWVGTGWSLNPGTVNRTMRGIPDDFDGSKGDKIGKEYSRKEFKKVGGQIVLKPSILAWEFGSASLKLNVYKDNYYGIGASVGASVGFSLSKNSKSPLTAGLNLDVNSDVRNGVDVSPNLSLSASYDANKDINMSGSLSGGFTYNSRAGLKNVSLSSSFSTTEQYKNSSVTKSSFTIDGSAVHYFGQSHTPTINNNTSNSGFTFSFDLGPSIFGGYIGIGGSGYFYKERNLEPSVSVPAYGYMNYAKGRKNEGALLDFNREKDGVFLTSAPAIPVPVATNDFFTATGQTGSQQFRPYFGGNYVAFDKIHSNTNNNTSIGVTIGGGNIFKGGARIDLTNGGTTTKKWTKNNGYLTSAEANTNSAVDAEPVYFKQVGEKTSTDNVFYNKFGNTTTGKVLITGQRSNGAFTSTSLKTRGTAVSLPSLVKGDREKRNYGFSYLTTEQAQKYALDKELKSYNLTATSATQISRNSGGRKPHHISDITVTDNEGKRMVYGIPVNNLYQEEVTFSVAPPLNIEQARRTGIVSYSATDASAGNRNGRDWLYTKEKTPSYTTSHLLTGILSPDYVDLTGNGISDDDPGTSVKFNYTKLTTDAAPYKWRAPYKNLTANFNEGFISDPKDDKANYVYGEKEIWYLNSVESKTMIAIFETSEREDGMGVSGNTGGIGSLKLKKLDRIKLYSKADWVKNGVNAVPIKVAHFVYDYSLYPGVHNNSGASVLGPDPDNPANTNPVEVNVAKGKGKLTLRMVYFTFGSGNRGKSNPYQFFYDLRTIQDGSISGLPAIPNTDEEYNDTYLERQTDRWGTYKKSFYNHNTGSSRTVNNSEFPYALQENINTGFNERLLADRLASKWQLNKIITPSSGIISVEYESDDYAFVQNRRAMQMCFIKGITSTGQNTGLINSDRFVVELPKAVSGTDEFKKLYLTEADGRPTDKIFYKIYTDLNTKNKFEYMHGYAEIDRSATTASGNTATIVVNKLGGFNPVAKAGWQMLRTDLPQFAYDGYDNSDAADFGDDLKAVIKSIIFSIGNLSELVRGFEKKAEKRGFSNTIDLSKSMVRLCSPAIYTDEANDFRKTGGGARVRKVQITDEWSAMTNVAGSKTAKYGQVYDYTVKDKTGRITSSGVASYEPGIGNEENPFHEPINFTEKVHWSSDRNHFIEKPFCETYFPAASVGYSKVTVTSFGDDYTGSGAVTIKTTGYIENEFYTAKDFPTIVDYLPLDQTNYENSLLLKLFSSTSINRVATSQGFKIELNDMHGKPKSVKVFNKGGDPVSSTEYFYRVKDQKAEAKELDNEAMDVLQTGAGADGTVTQATLATEIDFTSDVRESFSESTGTSIGGYYGGLVIPLFFVPLYIPYIAVNFNQSRTFDTYNSVSAVKVVNRFGIISKVVTTQNGSTIEAENLLWDGLTGEVLLTRTQNEYDKSTYAFNYPGHMVSDYEGMGAAYKNLGVVFPDFNTGANGDVSVFAANLFPGDELVSLTTDKKGWVIKSTGGTLRLIDDNGDFITATGAWMIMRSGRKNMLTAGVGSVVTMKDPRVAGKIVLDADKKILDSKSMEYKDEWGVPVAYCASCPEGYQQSPDGLTCYKDTAAIFTPPNYTVCEGDQIGQYSSCGSYIYSSYNVDGTHYNRTRINPTNALWIGFPADQTTYCNYTPTTNLRTINTNLSTKDTGSIKANNSTARLTTVRGPLNRSGIWTCPQGNSVPTLTWIGFSRTINVPTTQTYYIGMGSDNRFRFKVDGVMLRQDLTDNQENFKIWHIYPIVLTQGQHIIEMEGYNSGSSASFGAEIYNNTASEISLATNLNQLNIIFTTATLVGQNFETGVYTCPPGYSLNTSTNPYTCRKIVSANTGNNPYLGFNPYYTGVLGNWRPLMNYVYTVNRDQKPGNPNQLGGTDIRNSGSYKTYTPFWTFQNLNALAKTGSPADDRWVWSNRSVYYDQKGNEIESVDALNRFGSALFGYRQSVATAVGANARNNEIAFDGYEDYDFDLQTGTVEPCLLKRHLDFGFTKSGSTWTAPGGTISAEKSHTGKYSFKLSGSTAITKNAGNANPPAIPLLSYDGTGKYILGANELANGFAPVSGKKYLFSCWVYDNSPFTNTLNGVTISANGQSSTGNLTVVEGWKRIEIPFTASSTFNLSMSGSNVYVDDIRILPFDGQMNSYVYDNRTMRLMAQLDENNFATLYEYDDEGTPVRVKKETERGIMTLKENRQSLRKRN